MPRASGAFTSLKSLGQENLDAIDDMLTRGISAMQVTQVIQKEWQLLPDTQPGALKKTLERYRKSELKAKLVAQATKATEGMHARVLRQRLNAMEEMERLVLQQRGRWERGLELEAKAPLPLKQVTDEGRLLKEALTELGRLQLETGVLARVPKKVTGQSVDADGKITTFEWSTEQQQLLEQIEQHANNDS